VAGLDYNLGYVDNLSARSLADVRRFVKDYLTKPFVIGALTSEKDTREAARLLASYLKFVEQQ